MAQKPIINLNILRLLERVLQISQEIIDHNKNWKLQDLDSKIKSEEELIKNAKDESYECTPSQ